MLTYTQFTDLWTDPTPAGFGMALATLPSYHEYVQREIYYQDYLDLFIGAPTFNRVQLPPGGPFYIPIAGNPVLGALGIPNHPLYTNGAGNHLLVDYDYPWTALELGQQRQIKYIMVGEAPRPNPSNTFFYNHLHYGVTPWLNTRGGFWNCCWTA